MSFDTPPSGTRADTDSGRTSGGLRTRVPLPSRLFVAAVMTVAAAVAGLPHVVRADDAPPRQRDPDAGDVASRLDTLVEKLDRLVDRLAAERTGPPPPPHHGSAGPGPESRGGHREHRDRAERWERRPRDDHGGSGGGPGPWGEGRSGRQGPWGELPVEVREMMHRRMQEAQRRMDEAGEKLRELEERVRKLEAEVERLRSA